MHPDGASMPLELTVTAKGQVTLQRAVLDHLGVVLGPKVSVSLLENGRIELVAAAVRDDIKACAASSGDPGSGRSRSKKCRRRSRRAAADEDRCRYERPRPPSDMGR
jgi:hypothetical protein